MISIDPKIDKVAIIAPSSGIRDAKTGELDVQTSTRQLADIVDLFKQYNLECKNYENIFNQSELPYVAAGKNIRLLQLKSALEDPEIKIISAFRGGYGSAEIALEAMNIKPSGPKILIGFSDITALHLLFNQHYDLPSIHGMINQNFVDRLDDVFDLLSGRQKQYKLTPLNDIANKLELIDAPVTGGNLSVYASMLGTALSPNSKDKIVIIEDVGEPSYKIHRMLIQLYHSRILSQAKAIIFGSFSNTDGSFVDRFLEPSLNQILQEYLSNIPCYQTENFGHFKNYPFILGHQAQIQEMIFSIRPLAKLASGSKMLGDLGAQDRNVFNIHEDPSTKSTKQVAAEGGFGKRSIESPFKMV